MCEMKILGVALVILGIVGLVFGGIGYNRQTTILEVGGIKATATEHKTIPIGPIAGTIALVGGIALLVVPGSRRR
jgi:membrane-bound ClpP family serine protease